MFGELPKWPEALRVGRQDRQLVGASVDTAPGCRASELEDAGAAAHWVQRAGVGIEHAAGDGGIIGVRRVNVLVGTVFHQALRIGAGAPGRAGRFRQQRRSRIDGVTGDAAAGGLAGAELIGDIDKPVLASTALLLATCT